jgi:ERCC4-type nuclease
MRAPERPGPPGPVVAIDTREQKPYRFPRCEVKTLPTGDYSIVGLEDRIAIERKTKDDAYSSLGQGRARFERELERLSRFDYAAIVIETSLPDFLRAPAFSRMNPKAAANSIIAWSVKYRVCVFFAGDRLHGNALTRQLLDKFWRYQDGDRDAGSG